MTGKSNQDDMKQIQGYFAEKVSVNQTRLQDQIESMENQEAHNTLDELLLHVKLKAHADIVHANLEDQIAIPMYHISSMLLHDAFLVLNNSEDEDARFGTGILIKKHCYTIDRLLDFKFSVKTPTALKGDQASVDEVQIRLHYWAHKLFLVIHIHPGEGPGATEQSGIDMDYHRRMEMAGYPVIGAIFSRDRLPYLRFFSYEREFKVSIYGKGVEKRDENLYQLTQVGPVHSQRIARRPRIRIRHR